MRPYFFIITAWILVVTTLQRAEGEEQFLVRSWQSEDGLPSNNIRAMVQAADGYLWVATAEGVVRFDGIRFSSFKGEEGAMFGRKPPKELFALQNGEVWIETLQGGLLRWDGKSLMEIWSGPGTAILKEGQTVTQVWSGDEGQGEAFFEFDGGVYQVLPSRKPRRLEGGTDVTVRGRAARAEPWQHCVMAPPGMSLELLDARGRLWVRTREDRLAVYETSTDGNPVVLPQFPEGIRITALMEDREHNLWVATNGSGLFQVRARRVNTLGTVDGLKDRTVLTLMEDGSGAMWAASKSGGIDRIFQGRVQHFSFIDRDADRQIVSMSEGPDGKVWIAKENGSLFHWDGSAFQSLKRSTPLMRRVRAIVADSQGRLWLGGRDGLAVWADDELQLFGVTHGLPQQEVTALALDESQQMWIGTGNGDLYYGQERSFTKAATLGDAPVSAILPDKVDNAVWIATLGDGLHLYWKGGKHSFSDAQGLPDTRLTTVLADDTGHLWLGSLGGIFRVSKAELKAIAQTGRGRKPAWLRIDRADGLLSSECTGGIQPAGWRSRDGTLWFPTVQGIAMVQPSRLDINSVQPLLAVEEVRARNVDAPWEEGAYRAGPGRTRLEFRYTSLTFSAPEKVRFRIRLEGLDAEWQDVGAQRTATYEAVPPGRYQFQVMAANNDGMWSQGAASVSVHVVPHYWETLWFRTVAILTLIAVACAVGAVLARARLRTRMLQLEAQTSRHRERERIAQDLHDDLGASLTEISLLAGLAAEETKVEQRRDAMPVIAAKAQELVSTLDEIVWAVNPRHDTLASFVEYVTASAGELLDAAGITLRLGVAENLPGLELDTERRHALFLAVREALNNAVKHSAATEVELKLDVISDALQVAVKDNGKGMAKPQTGLSEGLRNMRDRLGGMGGTCDITSNEAGTRVIFSLPLRRKP
ncbi:MAG: two-component regulator propeller domain-containing protein [Verrucomicrobium sp.]|nr:two-component regulator propeller domain-containing protein [Verrucomicrobium sp.]